MAPAVKNNGLMTTAATNRLAKAASLPTRAYVTFLAGNKDYVKGVVGLAKGLRKVKSAYPLVVACLPDVPEEHRRILVAQGCIVREIAPVYPPENQTQFAMAYYVINYSKLRIWEFVEYSKMIYLDGDIQVFENIDHLFDLPNGYFYAVKDCFCEKTWSHTPQYQIGYCQQCPDLVQWPQEMGPPPPLYFNAGMFVYEPSLPIYDDLLSRLKTTPPTPFAEQMGDAIFEEATFCWKMEGVVKNGRDCIRDVFDQGRTNSCYAVAVTTTVNAASILKNGISLLGSVQELNDCLYWLTYQEPLMITPQGFPNRLEHAFCYTQHLGLFFESDYPFQGIVCECPEGRVPKHRKRVYEEGFTPNAPKPTGDYKIHIHGFDEVKETGSRDSEFYQRVEERLRIQPTTGAVCMTPTLAHWNLDEGGVYCGTPEEIGKPNHAVTVIGFGRKKDIDYYVCQNSYGTRYGCNGYLRIKRELVSHFYYPVEPYLVRYKDGQPDHVQQLDEVEEAIPMDRGKVRSAIANSTGNGDLEPARHID